MFYVPKCRKFRLIAVSLVLILFISSNILAQEATPDVDPSETFTAIPSIAPTITPTDVETLAPTETMTPIPETPPTEITQDVSDTEPTSAVTETPITPVSEVTEEPSITPQPEITQEIEVTEDVSPPTVTATPIVTSEPDVLPAEPLMSLLVREMFDNGDLSSWQLVTGWSLVVSERGQALQVAGDSEPLVLNKGDFHNVAVQARFLNNGGVAQISVRRSEVGDYTVALDSSGTLTLYRNGVALQVVDVYLDEASPWHTLRLSAVAGMLRVTVDDVEVIAVLDRVSLPPGKVALSGAYTQPVNDTEASAGVLLVDDFFLWVPTAEIGNYTPPTPTIPTEVPDTDGAPEVYVGKDTSLYPSPPRDVLAQAAPPTNDNFANALSIVTPYSNTGDSTAATTENNEVQSTCGVNVSYTVWYEFTPTETANYRLWTTGSDFDTILTVYTGSGVNTLSQISCSDDASPNTYTSLMIVSLSAGTTYHIQLGGYNGRYGNYVFGMQQEGIPVPRIGPKLLTPPNNFISDNDTNPLPALSWTEVTDAHHYELQIDDTRNFSSPVQVDTDIMGNSYSVSPLLDGTNGLSYSWRVRALNINNQPGPWSPIGLFVIDTTAPDAPALTNPKDGTTTNTAQQALTWRASKGAAGYFVDIDDDDNFASPIYADFSSKTPRFIPPVALPQDSYFWRLQAVDAAGNVSTESEIWSFTVNILTAPKDDTIFVLRANTTTTNVAMRWARVNGATGYMLYLYSDDTCNTLMSGYPIDMGTGLARTEALPQGPYCWKVQAVGVDSGIPPVFNTFIVSPALLPAPALVDPANNAYTNDTTPTLDWEDVTGATQYEVQWSTNAAFKTDLQSAIVNAPTSDYTLPTLPDTPGTRYYWRVGTINTLGAIGGWSSRFMFTLDTVEPDAPALTNPKDGTTTNAAQQALTWRASKGAAGYFVDIDDDDTFASPIYADFSSKTPRFIPPVALPQDSYFWRLQAVDAAGNVSTESDVWSFTVNILTAPKDDTIFVLRANTTTTNVAMRWARVNGATGYMLYLYSDDTCNTLMSGYPIDMGTGLARTETLGEGPYCWKVQAVGVDSSIPPVFNTFIVSPALLPAPALLDPANNAYTNDTTPTLDWADVPDAAQYEVQWSTNAAFKTDLQSAIVNAPTSDYTLPTLSDTPGTRYYWRVGTINALGAISRWSSRFMFTLDTVEPDAPALTNPKDGTTTNAAQQALTWRVSKGAAGYLVDIDDDVTFASPIYSDFSSKTPRFIPPVALPQDNYFWRLQAVDAAGNVSTESDVWSFTVNILTAPKDDTIFVLRANTTTTNVAMRWARVNGATGYMLYLYSDDTCNTLMSGYPIDMGTGLARTETLGEGPYCWKVQAVGVDSGIPPVFNTFIVSPALLPAPVLLDPANNAYTNDTTPTLDWADVPDAAQYEVQWSTNAAFKTDLQSAIVNAPTSDYTLPTLSDTPGTRYYWRVGTINALGAISRWSSRFMFTLDTVEPDAPALTNPKDGTTTNAAQQALTWRASKGAAGYLVDIDDDVTFASPIYADFSSKTPRFIPPVALPQDSYFWRLQAVDAAGNVSTESEIWSFTVNILTAPKDDTIFVLRANTTTTNVAMRWARVNGAMGYMLYLYSDDTCNTLMSGYPIDMGTLLARTEALPQGPYCWKVQAVGVDSGIPPVFNTFIVSPALLPAPALLDPANNAYTNDTTPTLDWADVPDAAQYEVQWSTNAAFKTDLQSAIVNAPTSEYTLPTLPDTPGTRYYWRVGTINALGAISRWSNRFMFTLDTVALDAPTLRSPANSSATTINPISFTWLKVSGATTYNIVLDTVNPPVNQIDGIKGTSYKPVSPLLNRTYYWQVQAVDAAGNASDWSDVREVKITTKPLAAPVLNRYAPDNPEPMDLPPTICWGPISWAVSYELQIDDNSNFSSPAYINDTIPSGTQCDTVDSLPDGTWYWRVRAIGVNDGNTNWSTTGTFTVEQ